MPFIPSTFYLVEIHFDIVGSGHDHTITFGASHEEFAGSQQELTDDINTNFATNVMPQVSSSVHMNKTVTRASEAALSQVRISPANTFGDLSASMLPPDNSALVRKQTSVGGPHGRGRLYLPGVPEGSVNNAGFIDGGYLSDLQDAWDAFWEDSFITFVVLHDDPVLDPYEIDSFAVSNLVANQRRRIRS